MQTRTFVRKTFNVEAIQVTAENIGAISVWCSGPIRTKVYKGEALQFVKVRVDRPLNERQTEAYIGDWVLHSASGFKVYSNKAFQSCFDEVQIVTPMTQADDAVEEMFREPTAS